ncbi:endonuclease/exonuclease/phosphatase family protein [Sphingomonas sp.]|uniref:endonuclease/exonuclease/phosphatase family protein n=1 Tax=Sphingomonas sp. TaxID=28214 RepID=UPI003D6CA431
MRIDAWLTDRLRFGFSEWNAPGYYDEHVLALLNLIDFALDRSIQRRAAMVLDLVLFDLARYTINGMFGVAASRSHFKHKNCGWHESPGDLIGILFDGRHGLFSSLNALSACSFASSRRYSVPDVILKIGRHRPQKWIDRTRTSINWSEAATYGIGFSDEADVMRWWSRASWFTKDVIAGTRKIVERYGLAETKPYQDILPKTGAIAGLLTGAKLAGYVAAGPAAPLLIPLFGNPFGQEDEVANAISIITEGSAYTRGNVYTYRTGNAVLSSTQNHRAGQLSFQGSVCQASLSVCATVFTSHPSAGGGIDRSIGEPLGATGGSVLGAGLGSLLGPAGTIAGGIIGGIKGAETLSKDVTLLPSDSDGPDWWTGSVTNPRVLQMKGAAILAYKPKAFQLLLFGHRFHAWFPQDAFDDLPEGIRGEPPSSVGERETRSLRYFPFRKPSNCNVETGRWVFGRVGGGYIGLFSGQMPHWTHDGDWACKEIMVNAERNIFIVQIGDEAEFGSYEAFVERVLGARIHINGLNWKLSDFECSYDIPNGSRLELHYDKDEACYAGLVFSDDEFPRIENGYAQIAWQQKRYRIQQGGSSLTHDISQEQRTVGGYHPVLDHPADLRIYSQNMGLFYAVAPYNGSERDKALAMLIAVLRADRFDVVGLSEMWHDADRERIAKELGDLYPYRLDGPDEFGAWRAGATLAGAAAGAGLGALVGGFGGAVIGGVAGGIIGEGLPLGSGLFLLSRHPITGSDACIYRQCAGEDCGANKGVVHARIQPPDLPCPLDVFLSHTQNLTPLVGTRKDAYDTLVAQINHLGAFIHASRDARSPAILLGDLNVDGLDQSSEGKALLAHLYAELKPDMDLMPKYQPPTGAGAVAHPEATSERDGSGISSFPDGSATRLEVDPARFQQGAQRLDYFLVWQGVMFEASYDDSVVVNHQSSRGRDMSDHYGIRTRLAVLNQLLPIAETEIRQVSIALKRVFCFETTSGPGDDEVRLRLRIVRGDGREQQLSTGMLNDMEDGSALSIDTGRIDLPDPGEFLILAGSGEEIDDLSADDPLGSPSLWLSRLELIAMKGREERRSLPRFTGGGGQYALEVSLIVT